MYLWENILNVLFEALFNMLCKGHALIVKINNHMLKSKPLVFLSPKFLNRLTARKDASRIISNRLLSTYINRIWFGQGKTSSILVT